MAMLYLFFLLSLSLVAPHTCRASSSPPVSMALMWSSHHFRSLDERETVVSYQTLSPKSLADIVLSEGGWAKLLCSDSDDRHHLDIALIFVGSKLKSSYPLKRSYPNQHLTDFLELAFRTSNFSMVFPYISLQTGTSSLEKLLVSEIDHGCGEQSTSYDIAVMESCLIGADSSKNLAGFTAAYEYMGWRVQTRQKSQTDLVVVCAKSLPEFADQGEGKILSGLVSILEESGVRYSVLYASEPTSSLDYSPKLARFLSNNISIGNETVDAVGCDGVCRIKSTLLEGVFVGIVLLIILLSGLCCMLGIDTPTKFEAPQDS